MISCTRFRSLFTTAVFILLLLFAIPAASAKEMISDLAEKVASLELGMNGYTIGATLSDEKKKFSADHLQSDAYEGTYKFRDGDLSIVVAQKNDAIIALYQRNDEVDIGGARKIISGLMGLFGEPTAMAHDKLIYWAFDESGKVPEEKYEKFRDGAEPLDVLATVKFSSSFEITAEEPDPQQQGTVYFIISSDRLTEEFMNND